MKTKDCSCRRSTKIMSYSKTNNRQEGLEFKGNEADQTTGQLRQIVDDEFGSQ